MWHSFNSLAAGRANVLKSVSAYYVWYRRQNMQVIHPYSTSF